MVSANPTSPLSEAFLPAVDASQREAWERLGEAVETALEDGVARGRAAWPELHVDPSALVRHVGSKVKDRPPSPDALKSYAWEELHLVFAVVSGSASAMDALDRRYLADAASLLARSAPDLSLDELRQLLRLRLLMPRGDKAPRIVSFRGEGPLGGWLRVAGTRALVDHLRLAGTQTEKAQEGAPEFADVAAQGDPELEHIRREYGDEFKAAFKYALAKLEPGERNLLRQSVLHGLSGDQLAALYGVHRATPTKWLAKIRAQLLRHTRDRLAEVLALSPDSLDSLMRVVTKQMDVSLTSVLGPDSEPLTGS
jgi:RNA polymerase sigma-70 factor